MWNDSYVLGRLLILLRFLPCLFPHRAQSKAKLLLPALPLAVSLLHCGESLPLPAQHDTKHLHPQELESLHQKCLRHDLQQQFLDLGFGCDFFIGARVNYV